MTPTIAEQLRDIAGTLRAQIEEGEFEACDVFTQTDMETLPATLERIANQADAAARMGEGRA